MTLNSKRQKNHKIQKLILNRIQNSKLVWIIINNQFYVILSAVKLAKGKHRSLTKFQLYLIDLPLIKPDFLLLHFSEWNNKAQTKLGSISPKPNACGSGGRIINTNQLFKSDECNK